MKPRSPHPVQRAKQIMDMITGDRPRDDLDKLEQAKKESIKSSEEPTPEPPAQTTSK